MKVNRLHHLGIFDEDFIRGKTPMTKREVRILSLNEAKIEENSVVYDIGAGTGSLSVEAALLAPSVKVYAIEKNSEGVELIKQNAKKFNVKNIEVLNKTAPDGMDELPFADVILIGGSGGEVAKILKISLEKLKQNGRIVINTVTIETLYETIAYLKKRSEINYYFYEVAINRYFKTGKYHLKKSENPISIIVVNKK
ncbi:MAG: precorrin-6Y C5,15-methyltransferase (decarboxylating) subunit CbiT [Selenomonadaceae bacterium]|nr:precorrin-6Y C5,15-methyltransferase (decarboxylating) subunit CbiT [Selenomonadaceae bacterium]